MDWSIRVLATALCVFLSACGGGGGGSGGGGSSSSSGGSGSSGGGSSFNGDVAVLRAKFTLPQQDAGGWSILTPSSDSRLIYVSTSGNDTTAHTYTTASPEVGTDPYNPSGAIAPYATIDAALAQARAGYPDYILLKRGDTWTRTAMINMKAGRSASERMVLGSFGPSTARPIVKGYGVNLGKASYSALVGIQFTASRRNPTSPDFAGFANADLTSDNNAGFDALGGYNNTVTGGLLIEDCWFDWFSESIVQSPLTTAPVLTDVIIRRNLFTNSYSTSGHAQGLYSDRASVWLEENIFDHNGWYKQGDTNFSDPAEGKATMFNHNTYFAEARDTVFRNNLFLRASSIGNKFTSNTASGINVMNAWSLLIDNNLYVEGEVGISLGGNDDQNNGPRWQDIYVTNNVMMHIGRTQPTLRTLGWGLDVQDWNGGRVSGNVFAHWGDTTLNNNFAIYSSGHTSNVTYSGNVIYDVTSGNPLVAFRDGAAQSNTSYLTGPTQTGIVFTNNDIWTSYTGPLMFYSLASNAGFGSNMFQSARSQSQWFSVNNATASFDQYKTAAGDTTSAAGTRNYVDPTRTIETYLTSIGQPTDMASFVAALTAQSKANWNPALGAAAINDYVRAGFATH
ncbi:MAG TPA: hypothetical protein VMC81_02210 [Rhodocyclaceae bacterium]|nr:hypothetical protein [Rhodocyclaceae bacterium]